MNRRAFAMLLLAPLLMLRMRRRSDPKAHPTPGRTEFVPTPHYATGLLFMPPHSVLFINVPRADVRKEAQHRQ